MDKNGSSPMKFLLSIGFLLPFLVIAAAYVMIYYRVRFVTSYFLTLKLFFIKRIIQGDWKYSPKVSWPFRQWCSDEIPKKNKRKTNDNVKSNKNAHKKFEKRDFNEMFQDCFSCLCELCCLLFTNLPPHGCGSNASM